MSIGLDHYEPPHERRYFVHKKLISAGRAAVRTFVPGGGIALDVAGVFTRRSSSQAQKNLGAAAKLGGTSGGGPIPGGGSVSRRMWETMSWEAIAAQLGVSINSAKHQWRATQAAEQRQSIVGGGPCEPKTCLWPRRWDAKSCSCVTFLGSQPGPDPDPSGNGVVTEGGPFHHPPSHFHPVQPEVWADGSTRDGQRRRCPARYKLGIDNLCYFNLPRNSKFRKWRPGRKPLFTGGDLNAIATAGKLADAAEDIFKDTNPAKKAVARNYRANWRKPLKK